MGGMTRIAKGRPGAGTPLRMTVKELQESLNKIIRNQRDKSFKVKSPRKNVFEQGVARDIGFKEKPLSVDLEDFLAQINNQNKLREVREQILRNR